MTGRIITTQIIVTLHHPAAATNPVTPVFPALRDRRAVLDLREFQARKDQWVLRVLPEETEQQGRQRWKHRCDRSDRCTGTGRQGRKHRRDRSDERTGTSRTGRAGWRRRATGVRWRNRAGWPSGPGRS